MMSGWLCYFGSGLETIMIGYGAQEAVCLQEMVGPEPCTRERNAHNR